MRDRAPGTGPQREPQGPPSPLTASLLFPDAAPVPVRARTAAGALPILAPALLFALGVGIVAWVYALRLPRPFNYTLFWVGLGLCLAATLTLGLRRAADARHQVAALAAFGAATWLPHYLRSPARPLFSDELFHYQIVQLIAEQGHTALPVTLYPIPGEFPALAFVTLALAGATGLPLDGAARLLTLVAHALIPLLAYLAARGLGLGRRGGFIAALIYIANTSYYFFHAVFSYETLGIVFVLTLWVLVSRQVRGIARRDLALAAPVLAALAVTHHLSSYLLAASLVVVWVARWATRRFAGGGARADSRPASGHPGAGKRRPAPDGLLGAGACVALAVFFPLVWTLLGTARAVPYLSSSLVARLAGIARTIQGFIARESAARPLFTESPLPAAERLVDFAYVPLLLVLGMAGLGLVLRYVGPRQMPHLPLALALSGPLAWCATVPVVLTPAAELAYRSWPFLFLGLAFYGAVALTILADWLEQRSAPAAWLSLAAILGLLLTGGISIGDNQAGRFPTAAPTKAAGPEAITADLVSAAEWLERSAGRYHLVVGDGTTQAVFATTGFQRATMWGNWTPFLARDPAAVSRYLRASGAEYLLVDQRISRLPPRYGFYFGDAEIHQPEARPDGDPDAIGRPLSPALLAKFDRVPELARIYDNGDIQIHQRRRLPNDDERQAGQAGRWDTSVGRHGR